MAAEMLDDELRIMEVKLKQLKLDYEQYFCGSRPREPQQLRREVQKLVTECAQAPIRNTALRFRFNSINSRFQCFKRQWDTTLREIESGTYTRHLFKADLHERESLVDAETTGAPIRPPGDSGAALFDSYRDAALACGQDVSSLTPEKLQRIVDKQQDTLCRKLKCDAVDFRVIVKDGRVKLRASARR